MNDLRVRLANFDDDFKFLEYKRILDALEDGEYLGEIGADQETVEQLHSDVVHYLKDLPTFNPAPALYDALRDYEHRHLYKSVSDVEDYYDNTLGAAYPTHPYVFEMVWQMLQIPIENSHDYHIVKKALEIEPQYIEWLAECYHDGIDKDKIPAEVLDYIELVNDHTKP